MGSKQTGLEGIVGLEEYEERENDGVEATDISFHERGGHLVIRRLPSNIRSCF